MRSVLITGGLGFIGLNLSEELTQHGYSVILFDNFSPQVHGDLQSLESSSQASPNLSVVRGDVTDASSLRTALRGVDAIVHLAAETGTAQSMYQVSHYNWVNSQGTAVLLDILANEYKEIKKVVLASSRSIYGEGAYRCASCGVVYPEPRPLAALQKREWEPSCPSCHEAISPMPTPETAKTNPASIYAVTKLSQEGLVRIACSALGIKSVILRLQNVYGEGQSLNNPYTGILSIFSTRIRQGLNVPIYEDGSESRDFIYVSDVARAVRLSLENDQADGKILNIGSGKPTTVLEMANLLVKALGSSSRIQVTSQYRLGDIRHCYADVSLVSKTLGFQPEVSLNDGIGRFVRWVKTQPLSEDKLDRANEELSKRKMLGLCS